MLILSMHSITLRPSINLIYLALLVIFPCRPRFLLFSSISFYSSPFFLLLQLPDPFISFPHTSYAILTCHLLSRPQSTERNQGEQIFFVQCTRHVRFYIPCDDK